MGNALQDQLLKAGLISDKQLKKARKEKVKDERRGQTPTGSTGPAAEAVDHQRLQQEKAARDRELNRQHQAAAQQKAALAQVRQLIEGHREKPDGGERPYHFVVDGKIKRLYVTAATTDRIAAGRLAIAMLDGRFELIPAEVAEKVRARDASSIVLWNEARTLAPEATSDEYAGYDIPDDLVW